MERIRTLRLQPYLKGHGPTFDIAIYDYGRDRRGAPRVAFGVREHQDGRHETIIDGQASPEQWCVSGRFAQDSDRMAEAVLAFVGIQPGDTDPEFFASYTPRQLAFAQAHGEAIDSERERRFCDENGNPR